MIHLEHFLIDVSCLKTDDHVVEVSHEMIKRNVKLSSSNFA
jgi:hypothetical protein